MHVSSAETSAETTPTHAAAARAVPLIFCALAFGVSILLYDRMFSTYDDGIAAEGARLILQGQVP